MMLLQEPVSVSIDAIMLATDFSGASEKATAYAKALARRFESTLEMVHVIDPSAVPVSDGLVPSSTIEEKLRRDLANVHRDQLAFMESGVVTKSFTAEGRDAAQTVMDLAHDHKSDLIVAGTQAKSGVERLVFGSTSEKLIRNAECPVLTIGPNASWPTENPTAFRCIVYATDFSIQSSKAARYAVAFSAHSGARLCCCHVESNEVDVSEGPTAAATVFTQTHKHMIHEKEFEGFNPEFFVERGEPVNGILQLARKLGADLIVLGSRKSTFWLKYVDRGLIPNLIAGAKCPVMTVC